MTPGDGVGTTWSFTARLLVLRIEATYTRDEFVPNKRIVDRNPDARCGVAFDFKPDATGTTLTMAWLDSSRFPLLTRLWDRIYWDGEKTPSVECTVGHIFCLGLKTRLPVLALPIN